MQKLLTDRGVDPARAACIGSPAHDRLATILEGGDRHLLAVMVPLPPADLRSDLLAWLEQSLEPVLAEISPNGDIALLVASAATADAINAGLLAAFPALGPADVTRLDGSALDHPWAPTNALRPGSGRGAEDNQVRVPVEILDRLFGRIGEFFNISSALNVLVVELPGPRNAAKAERPRSAEGTRAAARP